MARGDDAPEDCLAAFNASLDASVRLPGVNAAHDLLNEKRERYGLPRLDRVDVAINPNGTVEARKVYADAPLSGAVASQKPGFELLPGEALGLVNEAMRSGVGKYGAWDWASGVSVAEYGSKAIGHILDGLRGLPVDAQSGVTPFANAAADLLILISCVQRGVARDVPAPCADVRPCREFSYQNGG